MPVNQLGNDWVQDQRAIRFSLPLLASRWSWKAMRMLLGWLHGSIYWMLSVWGQISVSKTMIPKAGKHFLTAFNPLRH